MILITSCSKSNKNYNYNINTVNPAALSKGTLVADINGLTTYFDSTVSVGISYGQINTDTEYIVGITGYNKQSAQTFQSIVVSLKGFLPFDTASFYNYNLNISSLYQYQLGYNLFSGAYFNAYNISNGTEPLYQARITYVDDSTIQGNFSGYLPPYNVTNGAFNLKTNIPGSFIK